MHDIFIYEALICVHYYYWSAFRLFSVCHDYKEHCDEWLPSLRDDQQPTPVFLPGESQGRGTLSLKNDTSVFQFLFFMSIYWNLVELYITHRS